MEPKVRVTSGLLLLQLAFLLKVIVAQEACETPSYEAGVCVPYGECQFVRDLFQRYGSRIPLYFQDYIRRSKCSRDNEPIRLCCQRAYFFPPISSTTTRPPRPTPGDGIRDTDYGSDYVSQLHPQGFKILDSLSCGQPGSNRISGGNETNLSEFPWMALLRYDSPGEVFKCGGSLITNRFVLTAAHCVYRIADSVVGVRLGEHDLDKEIDCQQKGIRQICAPPAEDFGIAAITPHPKYSLRERSNDVALIKLDRNVEFKRHIKPICLPITPESTRLTVNEDFFIAGWGTTEYGHTSRVLLKAIVSYTDSSVCQSLFRNVHISKKHICAGDRSGGMDTCKGDSGGPLFFLAKYKATKRFIQYGVVSFGSVTCSLQQSLPGLYANVITFMPWITNNIL